MSILKKSKKKKGGPPSFILFLSCQGKGRKEKKGKREKTIKKGKGGGCESSLNSAAHAGGTTIHLPEVEEPNASKKREPEGRVMRSASPR